MTSRSHANAPLSLEGRRRLIERCRALPITHVAEEMGVSRATASKLVNRCRRFGEFDLLDRSSTPIRQPSTTPGQFVDQIESMRRECKWSASRIAFELNQAGTSARRRTVTQLLAQLGLNTRKFPDPNGETNREPRRITAKRPGPMVYLDIEKVGRIRRLWVARTLEKQRESLVRRPRHHSDRASRDRQWLMLLGRRLP